MYWISTVRPDGRPHVTTLLAVLIDDAAVLLHRRGGAKAKNLAENPHCILTTGCNTIDEGLDVVVESDAVNVRDGMFHHGAGEALVFEVAPTPRSASAKASRSARPAGASTAE